MPIMVPHPNPVNIDNSVELVSVIIQVTHSMISSNYRHPGQYWKDKDSSPAHFYDLYVIY